MNLTEARELLYDEANHGSMHPRRREALRLLLDGASAPDGAARIAAERRRQIEEMGWTTGHDDGHARGEIAQAAACYAVATVPHYAGHYPVSWPWSPFWDSRPGKSSDVVARVRALEKAGALCAAEIDRLLRERRLCGATT